MVDEELSEDEDDWVMFDTPATSQTRVSKSDLQAVRKCLSDTVYPSWLEPPPMNLGEASHGKLKAAVWKTLFTSFLPMALADTWQVGDPRLVNLFHLSAATCIIDGPVFGPQESQSLKTHLLTYLHTLKSTFPHAKILPNHHNSLHFSEIASLVGPLRSLAAWAGERTNYTLSRVPTNKHPGEMEITMLTQVTRASNIKALLFEYAAVLRRAWEQLRPLIIRLSGLGGTVDAEKDLEDIFPSHGGKKAYLDQSTYNKLVQHIRFVDPPINRWQNAYSFPLDLKQPVISPHTVMYTTFKWKPRRPLSTTTESIVGNSLVCFIHPKTQVLSYGIIKSIFSHSRQSKRIKKAEIFLLVQQFPDLLPQDIIRSPYRRLPLTRITIKYEADNTAEQTLCRLTDIKCHLIMWRRPAGTYGISRPTVVLARTEGTSTGLF
ncbi:hypothetical protein P7C70_g8437, partial [Phenoliferia sp. Uapishka_3]